MDKLEIVDIETVCAVFSISDRQVRTWVKDFGCPSRKDRGRVLFYFPDVLSWYVGYASSKQLGVAGDFPVEEDAQPEENLQGATLRKTVAEANLKQLMLSKLRGETINIGDAKVRIERTFGNLRTALLGMAPKLGTRLAGVQDPAEIEATCKEEMEALCRELSTGQIVGIADPVDEADAIDDLQASAEDIVMEELLDSLADTLAESYATLAAAEEFYASVGD